MSAFDTVVTDVRKVAALIEPMVAVIAVAEAATGIGGPSADAAVQVIAAAIKSLTGIVEGKVTHDQALVSMSQLLASLATNDAAADAALAARFSPTPTGGA
jgi:hypothetical protein